MSSLTIDQFRRLALHVDGKTLLTLRSRRAFRAGITAEGLTIAPLSSGVERSISWTEVDRFLAHFNTIASFTPVLYRTLTFNASYLLAVVKALTNT